MKKFVVLFVLCIVGKISFAQSYSDILKSKAELEDAKKQYSLYYYYANRNFEESDIGVAVSHLLQAAENEYPEALYELGCCYKDGLLGLPVWPEKAKEYLFRASEMGYSAAKEKLYDLTKDYEKDRKRIRRAVCNQIISVAPKSRQGIFDDNKRQFVRQ